MAELKTSSRLERLSEEIERVLNSHLLKVDALTKFLARVKAAVELEKVAVIIEDGSLDLNGLDGEATSALVSSLVSTSNLSVGTKAVVSGGAHEIVEANFSAEKSEGVAVSAVLSSIDCVDGSDSGVLSLTDSVLQLPDTEATPLELVAFILELDAEQNGHKTPRRGLRSGEVKREIQRLLGRTLDSKDPSKKLSAMFANGKVQRTDNRYWIPSGEKSLNNVKTKNSTTSDSLGYNGVSSVGAM